MQVEIGELEACQEALCENPIDWKQLARSSHFTVVNCRQSWQSSPISSFSTPRHQTGHQLLVHSMLSWTMKKNIETFEMARTMAYGRAKTPSSSGIQSDFNGTSQMHAAWLTHTRYALAADTHASKPRWSLAQKQTHVHNTGTGLVQPAPSSNGWREE